MKFYSSYNAAPRKVHSKCPRTEIDYIKDITTGELVACGEIPIYERIQSYHDSTCLTSKLKRFALGDSSTLGSAGGSFGDFTNMPSDLRQVLDSRKKIEQDFASLPGDIRGIFEDSYTKFEEAVRNGTAERLIAESYARSSGAGVSPGTGAGAGTDGSSST